MNDNIRDAIAEQIAMAVHGAEFAAFLIEEDMTSWRRIRETADALMPIVERVRAEQREADAQIAESRRPHIPPSTDPKRRQSLIERSTLNRVATAIRAATGQEGESHE